MTLLALAAIVIIIIPVVYLAIGSFRSASDGLESAFTFSNWGAVYSTTQFLNPLRNSVIIGLTVAALSVVLGAFLAWTVERTNTPLARLFGVLVPIPIMISPLLTALAWVALSAPTAGFLNSLAKSYLGIDRLFDIYSMPGIVLVMVLHYTPFAYLAIRATLSTIDLSLEDASYVLGVKSFATARRMTLPLLRPALAASAVLIFVFAVEDFSVPALLGTPANISTLPSMIYQLVDLSPSDPGRAAASATLLIWLAVIGIALQRRISGNASRYATIGGKRGGGQKVNIGRLRWITGAIATLYVLLALVLPYCALVFAACLRFVTSHLTSQSFTTDNFTQIFNSDNITAVENTLILSIVGSFVGVIVFAGLSFIITRTSSPLRKILDFTSVLPFALPGIVLGVGFLWAFVDAPASLGLYGTVFGLGVAYIIRFSGLGVRTLNAASIQISPDLEEAARTLGDSRWRAYRNITLPLMKESLKSLWVTLFVLFALEVSVTIIIYSSGSQTLSVLLWNEVANGAPTAAFAIASVQVTAILLIATLGRRFLQPLQSANG